MRAAIAAAAALAWGAFAPQWADAATIALEPGSATVTYAATSGEANALSVSQSAGLLTFADAGTAGGSAIALTDADGAGGCDVDPLNPSQATCPATATAAFVAAGDEGDSITADPALGLAMTLDGGAGNDSLTGGAGADRLAGGEGDDALTGGAGTDIADYSALAGPVTVDLSTLTAQDTLGAGTDTLSQVENLTGTDAGDSLTGDGGSNVVLGGGGDDDLSGGVGDDSLDGAAGNDTLEGGSGNDTKDGGPGTDTFSYAGAAGPVTVSLAGSSPQDTVGAGADALGGGEHLTGSDNDDSLTGDDGPNVLDAGTGNDVLAGGLGADVMSGGPGEDTADYSTRSHDLTVTLDDAANDGAAGEGDDVRADVANVIGGSGSDILTGDAKQNRLSGGPGNDTLDGREAADTLAGGPGLDTLSYAARAAPVTVDLGSAAGSGEAGENDFVLEIEGVAGGTANDRLSGSDGPETLDGGAGNDIVEGRGGADAVIGGPGNDLLYGGDGDDRLEGSEGGDLVRAGAGADGVAGGSGDDILEGGPGGDTMTGGGGADTVDYSLRTARVRVTFDGRRNDGEVGEGDAVGRDVQSVRTGSGKDLIDARDGARGNISCGSGFDAVRADAGERVANDCEELNGISSTGRCRATRRAARMSRRGVVVLRVACRLAVRGSVVLHARVRAGERRRARSVRLARRTFALRERATTAVRLRLGRKERRMVRRAGPRLRARAVVTTRRRGGTTRRTTSFTLRVPG